MPVNRLRPPTCTLVIKSTRPVQDQPAKALKTPWTPVEVHEFRAQESSPSLFKAPWKR